VRAAPLLIVLAISSCRAIDQKTLAAWTASDGDFMKDLEAYRAAQKKASDDVLAHEKKAFSQISADEENLLMTELLADVNKDPSKSQDRKTSYGNRVQAHLDLFNALKGN
jgi:hypothetical protein